MKSIALGLLGVNVVVAVLFGAAMIFTEATHEPWWFLGWIFISIFAMSMLEQGKE